MKFHRSLCLLAAAAAFASSVPAFAGETENEVRREDRQQDRRQDRQDDSGATSGSGSGSDTSTGTGTGTGTGTDTTTTTTTTDDHGRGRGRGGQVEVPRIHVPGDVLSQLPQALQDQIARYRELSQAFVQQQRDLAASLRTATEEERNRIREQMRTNRERFLADTATLRTEIRDQLREIRQTLRDQTGSGSGSGSGRGSGRPRG